MGIPLSRMYFPTLLRCDHRSEVWSTALRNSWVKARSNEPVGGHTVAQDAGASQRWIALRLRMLPITRRCRLHHPADRRDTVGITVLIDLK
jgi:hypothetical protein